MKIIKSSGLIFFILSYLSLVVVFIYENELDSFELPYGLLLWGIGIINVIFNIIYGAKIKLTKWLFISMIISGFVWLFIPLIYTYFGAPFLVIYFLIVVYMYLTPRSRSFVTSAVPSKKTKNKKATLRD